MQSREEKSKDGCGRRVWNFFKNHNIFENSKVQWAVFTLASIENWREGGTWYGSPCMGALWAFACAYTGVALNPPKPEARQGGLRR